MIELKGLSKRYGDFHALKPLDLRVQSGEFVTILGPSGSGKTTMLLLLAGLLKPSGGAMFIAGEDATLMPPQDRHVGLVFQSYALFPNMTVQENVAFPLSIRGVSRDEVANKVRGALELVRLAGLAHRRPDALSGGQQQRVALARAIVFSPKLLLLDEPLGALDRKLRVELQVELKQLQRRLGVTTLMVTHDQEEALSLSDRLVVLNEGSVQQIGSPEDVYLRPTNRFVAEFLGIANFLGAGDHGASVVRPESIQLVSPMEGEFAGCIEDTVYLGHLIRYHIALDDGTKVVCMRPSAEPRAAVGDRVGIRIPNHLSYRLDGSLQAPLP